jgi:DNA-binding GntR family transcriptional regulator
MEKKQAEDRNEIYTLFAIYLRKKIEEGVFPKGSILPSASDFMMVFKLNFADVLKAILDLERRGLVRGKGNSVAEVVVGKTTDKPVPFDVRQDINRLFARLERLEHKALDNAWPRVDREALRILFTQNRDATSSRRIWRMNMALYKQTLENCSDVDLCMDLAAAHEDLEFFRQLYLAAIPQSEVCNHALAVESIVRAFISCKLGDAHFHISSYIAMMHEKLLDIFKEKYILPYVCAATDEGGKNNG